MKKNEEKIIFLKLMPPPQPKWRPCAEVAYRACVSLPLVGKGKLKGDVLYVFIIVTSACQELYYSRLAINMYFRLCSL